MERTKQQRSQKRCTFSTFMYEKVSRDGHKGVRSWTKGRDIFSYDYVFIPVHLKYIENCLPCLWWRLASINCCIWRADVAPEATISITTVDWRSTIRHNIDNRLSSSSDGSLSTNHLSMTKLNLNETLSFTGKRHQLMTHNSPPAIFLSIPDGQPGQYSHLGKIWLVWSNWLV